MLSRRKAALVPFILFTLSQPLRAQDGGFGERELKAIEEALHAINLRPEDLKYRKGPPELKDPSRLPIVDKLLHDPLAIPAVSDAILNRIRRSTKPSELIPVLAEQLPGGEKLSTDGLEPLPFEIPEARKKELPATFHATVARLAGAYRASRAEREKALSALTADQRKLLDENLIAMVVEEEEFGFHMTPELQKDQKPIWNALDQVKWVHLWRSGLFMMLEIERAVSELEALKTDWKGTVRVETPEGVVEISGVGNDRHELPAGVIIDLGGDDEYVGPACQAWIVDVSGNDRYRAGSASLGAGILDVRVLWDKSGDDIYEGEAMTEGFAAFGIGILLDDKGNDTYRAQMYAQGASRTWGFGLLADRTGDDIYQAGGRVIHKPLLEKERGTFGMAQGFSIGYRPDRSGGIGILWDGAGDDTYIGGTYTQGASYWFSFGLLADDSGNDKYIAFYYSQASAMHLTVAALIDGGGNDVYMAHMGAVHAIGHDWGVALLWDKGGNDVYAAGDSSPGVGVANGIGIFVDSGGDDRYMGPPGNGNPARDSGSVGIFVDLGGKDRYGRGMPEGGLALHNRWGVARHLDDPPAPPPPPDPSGQGTVPQVDPQKWHGAIGSKPLPEEAELEKIYGEASLWAVGSTRDRAWIGRRALIEMGLPAAKWMVEKKLGPAQSLEIEAFQAVLGEIGPECGKLLLEPLRSKDRPTLENALRLTVILKATAARDEIIRLLRDEKDLKRAVIGAAGALELKEAVPAILESAKDMDAFGRLAIAKGLRQIKDPAAIDWLVSSFDAELPVREACADALVKIGAPALEPLAKLARSKAMIPSRLALRALGELDKPECLAVLKERSDDPDWGVRLTVALALRGMKTEGASAALKELLSKEKDARVKGAVENLDSPSDHW